MQLIQFYHPEKGRRVGLIEGDRALDLTSVNPSWTHIHSLFLQARRAGKRIAEHCQGALVGETRQIDYSQLLKALPGDSQGWLLPPLDHPDPSHCLVAGTGLTHLGSMETRDQMHAQASNGEQESQTDSEKIFRMGLQGGKPQPGTRGVQPEWFYKGSGAILRAHNAPLDIPDFTEDGGEEPEIVGCYVIDDDGVPCRLGFAIGNEWADHPMERVNYLWLAPSKMRTCAVGPALLVDQDFQDLHGFCTIVRGSETLYHSGELLTGQQHMSHALANLEDHHFKHPQFRIPGDVHLHFFGTMKLSFPNRPPFENDDRIEIHFDEMGASLVNYVRRLPVASKPIQVDLG